MTWSELPNNLPKRTTKKKIGLNWKLKWTELKNGRSTATSDHTFFHLFVFLYSGHSTFWVFLQDLELYVISTPDTLPRCQSSSQPGHAGLTLHFTHNMVLHVRRMTCLYKTTDRRLDQSAAAFVIPSRSPWRPAALVQLGIAKAGSKLRSRIELSDWMVSRSRRKPGRFRLTTVSACLKHGPIEE